jgi:methylated-DNA-[protein]-cysteine S-methyltransferase
VNELLDKVRNPHAHPTFADDVSIDDTWRALDTAERLLLAIGSAESESVRLLRLSLKGESTAPTHDEARSQPPEHVGSQELHAQRKHSGQTPLMEAIYVPDLLGGLSFVSLSGGLRYVRIGRLEKIDRPGPVVLKAEIQVREYLEGRRTSFDLPLDLQGSPFQLDVWRALINIPYGETRSYRDIAGAVNKPRGSQAVGQANSKNPLLIVIPCHRVIQADGSLGGWEPGVELKRRLLEMEKGTRRLR